MSVKSPHGETGANTDKGTKSRNDKDSNLDLPRIWDDKGGEDPESLSSSSRENDHLQDNGIPKPPSSQEISPDVS